MGDVIRPRTLKGFRDYLPAAALPRERLIEVATRVYRSFGFSPIDTPALEYTEILLGKGSDETDKQLYRFEDQGGRDVAMRFDLTVPLARFVAQHATELGTPFKRYHVGTVWRGESPQRGRYREFLQCDFDTVGTENMVADAETGAVIHELFLALGFDRFTIRLNNRKLLSGLLERLDLASQTGAVLRALDKLPKIGPDGVTAELSATTDAGAAQIADVLRLATIEGTNAEVLEQLPDLVGGSDTGTRGLEELRAVVVGLEAAGVEEKRLAVDVSIARGLDYYTGTVYETFLDDLPDIGSCCSGGRYDDLASLYTKQRLPGIGASLGVDRLLAGMEELGMVDAVTTSADVLVTQFSGERWPDYIGIAAELRRAGISVELYPEPKKLGAQLKYADRRGHRLAVIIGALEWEAGTAQVKQLDTGATTEVALGDLAAECTRILSGSLG